MVDIVATTTEAFSYNMDGKIAVVIDVLRATSVMTIAIHNGAKTIRAVATPEEAFKLRSVMHPTTLLGGERHADFIKGFDIDNSPLNYTPEKVAGHDIIMTTTNGTQAIVACQRAQKIYIASLLNIEKTAELLKQENSDIVIVCAGTEGKFSIEDALCAGLIANELYKNNCQLTDIAHALRLLSLSDRPRTIASNGEHFARLKRKGYEADIDVCFAPTRDYAALICTDGVVIKA